MSEKQATTTVPGQGLSFRLQGQTPTARMPRTLGTALSPFEQVKSLLSDKPTRRPNRTRPLNS